MKYLIFFSSILLIIVATGCSKSVEPIDGNNVIDYTGTIYNYDFIKSDIVYKGQKEVFFPSNLPESFKENGLKVIFSGKRIECPPNAQCEAQEILLSSIKKLK